MRLKKESGKTNKLNNNTKNKQQQQQINKETKKPKITTKTENSSLGPLAMSLLFNV